MSPSGRSPLIELLRDRPVAVSARSRRGEQGGEVETAPQAEEQDSLRWLAPGRVIRIPVGYLMVAAAAFIALGIGAYSVGYEVAEGRVRSEFARSQAGLGDQPDTPTRDPLLADVAGAERSPAGTAGGRSERSGGQPGSDQQTAPGSSDRGAADDQPAAASDGASGGGDPREPGMNYVVLLLTSIDEAERAAAFLQRSGIDAGVFPANRPGWRHVIALRGFPAGTLDSAEFRRYKARLMELGRVWRRDHRGASDFSDMWEQKYDPGQG